MMYMPLRKDVGYELVVQLALQVPALGRTHVIGCNNKWHMMKTSLC